MRNFERFKLLILLLCCSIFVSCSQEKVDSKKELTVINSPSPGTNNTIFLNELIIFDKLSGWTKATDLSDKEFKLLHTNNGGYQWNNINLPSQEIGYSSPSYFLDSKNGWLTSSDGKNIKIYYTNDQGVTWENRGVINNKGAIIDINFYNKSFGWITVVQAVTGAAANRVEILSTVDGGFNWNLIPDNTYNIEGALMNGARLYSKTNGLITAVKSGQPQLRVTTDFGITWRQIQMDIDSTENLAGTLTPFVIDENKIVIPVITSFNDSTRVYFYVTIDGGLTWHSYNTTLNNQSVNEITVFDYSNNFNGWMTLDGHKLLFSLGDLTVWKEIANVASITGGEAGGTIIDLDFVTNSQGWVIIEIKGESHLYSTSDGGETWTAIKYNVKDN